MRGFCLLILLALTGCFGDDIPPCSPEEGGEWGPDRRPPEEPGPGYPPPPAADERGLGRNEKGELCECGMYDPKCSPPPKAENEGDAPVTEDVSGVCGQIYFCCAQISCAPDAPAGSGPWEIINHPLCPATFGREDTLVDANWAWFGLVQAKTDPGCWPWQHNCHVAPIGSVAECGRFRE